LSSYRDLSDIDLFHRISENDSKALEALYDRYSPLLYTIIKKIVQKEESTEDILVEIFAIIWRKIELFNFDIPNVYTWLVTLTRNKSVDYLRRIRIPNPITEPYDDEYENTHIIPCLVSEIDSLDIETAFKIKGKIEAALSRLTDAQKYVINLAYYEGYTEKGIAQKLNIPIQTVKSKIRIALNNLKENLVKEEN
jgi:RNA polymerase sigma factor (sigma-70 family)